MDLYDFWRMRVTQGSVHWLRDKAGMSWNQAARTLGVSAATVRRWADGGLPSEDNYPALETIARVHSLAYWQWSTGEKTLSWEQWCAERRETIERDAPAGAAL